MAVCIFEFRGHETDIILLYSLKSGLGERFHLHEPLHGELRLYHGISALGMSHFIYIILHLLHKTGSLEILHDLLAHIETVHTDIHSAGFGDCAVIIEDINGGESIFVAEHVVVYVMSGGDLKTASTEVHLNIFIHDDRHRTSYQRNDYFLSLEPCVTLIVRIYADSGIAQDSLGTCGGDNDVFIFLALHFIAEMEEVALFLLVYHLLVREGGES